MRMSNKELINRYLAAYTSFDVQGMLDLLSPDVVFENYLDDQLTAQANGIAEFRELAESSLKMFSEREQSLVSLRLDEDRAVAVVRFKGTFRKSYQDGPKRGDVMELIGKTEFEFKDGRITHIIDRA